MWPAVQGNDARLVDHLVAQHDRSRRLMNLQAAAVDIGERRAKDAAGDAAVVDVEVLSAGVGSGGIRRRPRRRAPFALDRKSTRLNSSHSQISYAVFCSKKKTWSI